MYNNRVGLKLIVLKVVLGLLTALFTGQMPYLKLAEAVLKRETEYVISHLVTGGTYKKAGRGVRRALYYLSHNDCRNTSSLVLDSITYL